MKSSINMSIIDWAAIAIVVIGALNWGFVGMAHFLTDAANWNIVNQLFGGTEALEFGIYLIVGLAALWTIYLGARLAGYGTSTTKTEMEPEARV